MKIKMSFIFCFSIALFSCNQKKRLESVLSVDCYWDILNLNSLHPINSCYKFRETGKCKLFYYNFFDKKRTDSIFLFDDGDVVIPNKWSLIKDSEISIRGLEYLILKYNSDSVFLKGVKNDTVVLIKNCKTFNLKENLSK